jgi:NAD(P)-dependent dehydrogenase (short-subunit alcohol dehydrogenase family)
MDDTPIVLITGAAHGLGLEIARQLAAPDLQIVITARDPDAAKVAAEQTGVAALPIGLDVADPASVSRRRGGPDRAPRAAPTS